MHGRKLLRSMNVAVLIVVDAAGASTGTPMTIHVREALWLVTCAWLLTQLYSSMQPKNSSFLGWKFC